MISLQTLSVVGFALVGMVNGRPTESVKPGIQVWSDPNFTGKFVHYSSPTLTFDKCHVIGADFPSGKAGGVSSIKADYLNECRIFPNTVCDPGSGNDNDALWVIGSYYDLGNPEIGWDNRAKSIKCTYCPTCNNPKV